MTQQHIQYKTLKPAPPTERQIGGDHYKHMAIQPTEFIVKNNLGWCEGNAIKYICRHNRKNQRVDLEKAKHYIDLLIELHYVNTDEV